MPDANAPRSTPSASAGENGKVEQTQTSEVA